MTSIPADYLDLVDSKAAIVSLATLMPDGTPQVTLVWFDMKGDLVRVNTALGRVKARNLKDGAAVALAIIDPANPYRYVQVRGHVAHTTTDGADAHIESLSHKYLGKPYPFRQPGEQRLIVEIAPEKVSASG